MNTTNINNITRVNLSHLSALSGTKRTDNVLGYQILEGKLVPNAFLTKLAYNLKSSELTYGAVICPEDVCSKAFYDALSYNEEKVLGAGILLLIRDGYIRLNVQGELYTPDFLKETN